MLASCNSHRGGCMLNRRDVLRMGGALGAAAFTPRPFKTTEHIAAASAAVADRTPEDVAQDEFYWREIQETRIQSPVPTTQDDLYQRFERAITPQTKVLHFCHITNLTGQLFPVQRLARLARPRGILTIVDGAHALAHFPFKLRDLEMDYYGVSLHKWLLAPIGNGLLYVRKENIAKTWPLQAVPDRQAG